MRFKFDMPIRFFGGDLVDVEILARQGGAVIVIELTHVHGEKAVAEMVAAGHPAPDEPRRIAVPLVEGLSDAEAIAQHLHTITGINATAI